MGGSAHPSGAPEGQSVAAIAAPTGMTVTCMVETRCDDRIANMAEFTRNALQAFEDALLAAGARYDSE